MTTYSSMQNLKSPSPSRNLIWNPDQSSESEWADSSWDTSSSSDKRIFKTLAWNLSSNNMTNGQINHLNFQGDSGIPNYPKVNPVEINNNPNNNTVNFRTDSHLAYHTGFTFEDAAMQDPDFGTSLGSPMTFSFWVKSTVAGTYVVELSSNTYYTSGFPPSEFRYACSKQYTINSADTWEKKTLTFPAYSSSNMGDQAYGFMFFVLTFWLAGGTNYTSGTLNSSYTNISADNTGRAVGLNSNFATAGNGKWHLAMPQLECSPVATQFTITSSKSFNAIKKSVIRTGNRMPWPGGVMGDFSSASQSYIVQPFGSLGTGNPNLGFLQTKKNFFFDKNLNLRNNTNYNLGNNRLYKNESGDSSSSATTVQMLTNDTFRLTSQLPGVNRGAMLAVYDQNMMCSAYFFDLTE